MSGASVNSDITYDDDEFDNVTSVTAAPFNPSGNYDTVVKPDIQQTIDAAIQNGSIQPSNIDTVIDKTNTGANPIVTLYVKYEDNNGELKIAGKFHVDANKTIVSIIA